MIKITEEHVLHLYVLYRLYKKKFITRKVMFKIIMKKIPYILPFSGNVYGTCHGIKKSDLLYNQCLNSKFKNNYCVKCYKQSVQNSNDLPRFGDITNRVNCGKKYKPMGNHRYCLPLANIVDVNNKFTIQLLDLYEKIFNVKIPKDEYEFKKITRGRPKSENKKVKVKSTRKRGRPKKVLIDSKESVEKTILDDMDGVNKCKVYVRKVFFENIGLVNKCDENYIWSDDGLCVGWWDSYNKKLCKI
jgi:hypothetical protein